MAAPRKVIMYVRVDSIAGHGLTGEQMIDATVLAMHDLAVVEALAMVHGDRGLARYFEMGGCMRFGSQGDAYVPVRGKPPPVNQGAVPRARRVLPAPGLPLPG